MEDERGFRAGIAACLPIDSMPLADIEHAGVIGFDVGMTCGHDSAYPTAALGSRF
jgi:hypothetical protein